jgi:predicted component of type VI protein secretion system
MSTHVHRLIPLDPHFVPKASDVQAAVAWLQSQVEALMDRIAEMIASPVQRVDARY